MNTAFAKPHDYSLHASASPRAVPDVVGCGTRVTIRRGILVSDVSIVGEEEAEPTRGRVAAGSPLGRALLGARRGDAIEYHAGGRTEEIRILAIAAARP